MGTMNGSAYEAAKNSWACYGLLLQEVAKELGWERAIATQEGVGSKVGEGLASAVLASCAGKAVEPGALAAVLDAAVGSLAIECEHQAEDGKVTGIYRRCPIYDGLAASGLDHAPIQKVCETWGSGERRRWRQMVPGVARQGKFRETGRDVCLEEYTLTA
jgi:hypothetical protein